MKIYTQNIPKVDPTSIYYMLHCNYTNNNNIYATTTVRNTTGTTVGTYLRQQQSNILWLKSRPVVCNCVITCTSGYPKKFNLNFSAGFWVHFCG